MTSTSPDTEQEKYKFDWIEKHKDADETTYYPKSNEPVSATYYYPPRQHEEEMKAFISSLPVDNELSTSQPTKGDTDGLRAKLVEELRKYGQITHLNNSVNSLMDIFDQFASQREIEGRLNELEGIDKRVEADELIGRFPSRSKYIRERIAELKKQKEGE